MPGTLFVVATPIGNLEDITLRALRVLREVQLIAAEDTRRTSKLLAHYEIRKRLISVREHNEVRETPRLLTAIESGEDVALVTDAGTPGIADPGTRVVRAAHERGVKVVPVPGASAVVTALSGAGYAADRFSFLGFPPSSGEARTEWFEEAAMRQETLIFFESPHRIRRTLKEASFTFGYRPISYWRELTKIHEVFVEQPTGLTEEKGEFAVIVGSGSDAANESPLDVEAAEQIIGLLTEGLARDQADSLELVARAFRMTPSALRRALKHARYARRQREPSES